MAEENRAVTRDSVNARKRFANVSAYVKELGGDKPHVIEKVLIANNGVAAVKAIRSIRRWAYDIFGNERAIQFVVMATPEDLRANAEYIRMADVIVDVPGGANNNNYANVSLIVELARLYSVHAVWAGWGHASENPVLPDTLSKMNPPIKFIGPAGPPMNALGDKIGSTIIAQTAGVPCISWNGGDVFAEYDRETGCLPDGVYESATIKSASHAYESAQKVGFPVMIKASEGGGGKGIRMVSKAEDVQDAYRQVCGEVPGSPIFIMKLSTQSRHLEVQLLADEYGDAIALNGRDCSVQRRHQKIIEEGPPIAAPAEVWREMENAAVALAKAVGYANAGTVEYLFSESDNKFYFLELNPRLQVEHPVTEMITNVNLPAAQLQVAMGIKLSNIPDIRELYGFQRFESDYSNDRTKIDFASISRLPPDGHCIAVRITAENAEAGFKPTSGGIQELNFRSTPSVWGYFSMDSSGSIHEFADSQFGHLFAKGSDREEARRNMVLALKELSIRGDISTTVDYISHLIEFDDYVNNKFDTSWLDKLIKANIDGLGSDMLVAKKSNTGNLTNAVIGALIVAFDECSAGEKQFLDALSKGQLPSQTLLTMEKEVELILDGVKYMFLASRKGPKWFTLSVLGSNHVVHANVRNLSDGGYLIDIGGKSRVAYLTSRGDAAAGMRISMGGATISFSPDYDPTSLRTDVAGKLVKKLVDEGAHVVKGQPYCEIEVMKMFMPLKASEAGTLKWAMNEGAALAPGDLIASMVLDNPENVAKTTVFEGELVLDGVTESNSSRDERPDLLLSHAFDILFNGVSGYVIDSYQLDEALTNLHHAISNPLLPVYEISKPLSVLSGRIDAKLYENLNNEISNFKATCVGKHADNVIFPADLVCKMITEHADSLSDPAEKSTFLASIDSVVNAAAPYAKAVQLGTGGQERVLQEFLGIVRKWIDVERWFSDGKPYSDVVDMLRKSNKGNYQQVLDICRSHANLNVTMSIVSRVIDSIADAMKTESSGSPSMSSVVTGAPSLRDVVPCLSEIGSMSSANYTMLAIKSRKLLFQESLPSLEERKSKICKTAKVLAEAMSESEGKFPDEVETFVDDNVPIADLLFPLLRSCEHEAFKVALVELYFRQMYRTKGLKRFQRNVKNKCFSFNHSSKQAAKVFNRGMSFNSLVELKHRMSLNSLDSEMLSKLDSDNEYGDNGPGPEQRVEACKIVNKLEDIQNVGSFEKILTSFPQFTTSMSKSLYGPKNVLNIIVLNESLPQNAGVPDEQAHHLEGLLAFFRDQLEEADVGLISFIFENIGIEQDYTMPLIFTFRAQNGYLEDKLFRNIEPVNSHELYLSRLGKNFNVERLESRQTSTANIFSYKATPRSLALEQDKKANKNPRIYVRALSYILDFSSAIFERMLVDSLNELDIFVHDHGIRKDNHLFMNLMSDHDKIILDPVVVEQIVGNVLKRYGDRISSLGVAEVEIKLVCRLDTDSPPIAIRMMASNPTGYVHVLNTYIETEDSLSSQPIFRLVGGTRGNLANSGDSSWEGMKVSSPYPLTRPFDAQRDAALKASDSLYCYDLPALFEEAVEQQWNSALEHEDVVVHESSRPMMMTHTYELVVQKKNEPNASWNMSDYLNNSLELVQTQRRAGSNNVGMVAWLMTLYTFEYPKGRQVVLITNDITHKAGSFGTREDIVFKLASEYSRTHQIPRLFVAANSGARIGLSDSIKNLFKVAFKNPSSPESGFSYLYITKDDYSTFNLNENQVIVEPALYGEEEVYKINDIIGFEPDLGVENLKGSGLIAGETSKAYNEIFTMTIVLGRTVGIGAYLVRLGQRTIQKTIASPIILTGYQALNKLMGVEVYSNNDQLGGPAIMYSNGVSHMTATDHLSAIKQCIQWLSYVPSRRGGILPISHIGGADSIDRTIDFVPSKGEPYDPRYLITGKENDDGTWLSGFFDKGSFVETLSEWAKSVVVGRARLGGIPMGVIVTENRTTESTIPADPADVQATEVVKQQAGGVWFPNSAFKTAQAINDFRTEDLPLMIFANWRGFSGGQKDMFEEVLKYGSLIVDAFVSFKQPIFVFIPPYAEIRGGAWVVVDASINANVMEMYAASEGARGGVLEANGTAAVKYRQKDLMKTMDRIDSKLKSLRQQVKDASNEDEKKCIMKEISSREKLLLPVYEQIAIQFCELHDTPGRMKAVGVIQDAVDWRNARSYFFWRLRRKLAEFDLREKIVQASNIGNKENVMTALDASDFIKNLFSKTTEMSPEMWDDDKKMLSWMAENHDFLEKEVIAYKNSIIAQDVYDYMMMSRDSCSSENGVVTGITRALSVLSPDERKRIQKAIQAALT